MTRNSRWNGRAVSAAPCQRSWRARLSPKRYRRSSAFIGGFRNAGFRIRDSEFRATPSWLLYSLASVAPWRFNSWLFAFPPRTFPDGDSHCTE